jgi:hypothetical protein
MSLDFASPFCLFISQESDMENVEESLVNMAKKESAQQFDENDYQDLDSSIMQDYLNQSELDIVQEAIERSILEQSMREYYSMGR